MSWINNTFQPNGADLWQQNGIGESPAMSGGYGAAGTPWNSGAGDGYRPSWWGSSASSGTSGSYGATSTTTNGLLAQIMALLQQLTGSTGTSGSGAGNAFGGNACTGSTCQTPPGTATFANATLSSTGDPHLAVNGTEQNANGTTTQINDHYDDMGSHRDLLSTNDFGDAFRVSTTATTPNANGITYNGTATATMNFGRDSVSMQAGGAVSVTSNGTAVALAPGGSMTLGGGEVVSENASGAVSIAEQNAGGESLTTTFTNNGSGVDVSAKASGGVTLGGSLVRHATGGV